MRDERYRVLFTLLAIPAVACYPVNAIGGLLYFGGFSLLELRKEEVRAFCLQRLTPLLPAIIIFAFTPLVLSALHAPARSIRTEVWFGISLCIKTGVILVSVASLSVTVSFSHFLRVCYTFRVPLRVLFILMIAHRFFSVFRRNVRQLVEARTLRLFSRSPLTGIRNAIMVIFRKAMGYTEALYIAMRVRGGSSRMALLAEFHRGKHDRAILFAGILGLVVPYLGYFILK